jgi:hypothetical protein
MGGKVLFERDDKRMARLNVKSLVREIRPSIRLLCGGVGGFLLSGAAVYFHAYGLVGAAPFALVGGVLLAVGTLGGLEDDRDPPGSERFLELADPSRTLSPEDFRTPTRAPSRAKTSAPR